MRKFAFTVLLLSLSLVVNAQIRRPKLVVGLVVDQMRWDFLYYYYDQYGEGGIKRLIDGGFSCENTMINYVPTVTAIGHSSIYTGSVPALTGICGNNFVIDGKPVYCVEDKTVNSVGSTNEAGQMSPRNMLATTIGDELKVATDFRSKVVGIALKDRAAILPAGHGADAAYWYDVKAGHFISSSYYMDKLPAWVEQFNRKNQTKPGFDVKNDPVGVSLTFKLAEAALENEQLGTDDITDLLTVSVSSTDAMGHTYGTRAKEMDAVYMQLDRDLTDFLRMLDEKVGRDNYLLFLTADHGSAHNPNFLKAHRLPAGGVDTDAIVEQLNERISGQFGIDKAVMSINDYRVFLNRTAVKEKYEAVKQAAIALLKENKEIQFAVDFDKAACTTLPQPIRERIINGYHPDRSGDIYIVPKPQHISGGDNPAYKGTTHSVWNPYDAHIPLVFYGWNVLHGSTSAPTRIVDIAPTVCAMLHIQMPDACIGNAITEVRTR
ncbi:MAG: alkaline phosphatase family protein [Prevotella sp.]|nr:alkaline phosphatase family protein [Prevotella sp.]